MHYCLRSSFRIAVVAIVMKYVSHCYFVFVNEVLVVIYNTVIDNVSVLNIDSYRNTKCISSNESVIEGASVAVLRRRLEY